MYDTSAAGLQLAVSLSIFVGCIRVCRRKALECEETKIEQHKLTLGGSVTPDFENSVKSNLGKIKALES